MALAEHNIVVTAGANPAAGAEFSVTVPVGQRWELLAVSVALVQGLTQTPLPRLKITDGTNTLAIYPGSSAAQAVSTTCQYTWGRGLTLTGQIGATTDVSSHGALIGLLLGPGSVISSLTAGIGANSDYGAPIVTYIKR